MQFFLPPWDRNRPRIQPPEAECVVSLSGNTLGLRAQNGVLFFRDANDQSKTWAIGEPLPPELEGDAAGMEQFFRREFAKGNVARYVVHLDSFIERTVPLFLQGDGTGWCREAWNRDDLPFTHSVSMHVLLEGADSVLTQDLRDVEAQLERQLSGLGFPEGVHWSDEEENIEWLCGSGEALQQVLGWACAIESRFWAQKWARARGIHLSVLSENPFSRAHIGEVKLKRAKKEAEVWFYNGSQDDRLTANSSFDKEALPSRRFWTLCDLALDENTPMGTYWEYHDYGMGRCADSPNPLSISYDFDAPTSQATETATASLRAWLRDKVPANEVEAILGDETPAEFPATEW